MISSDDQNQHLQAFNIFIYIEQGNLDELKKIHNINFDEILEFKYKLYQDDNQNSKIEWINHDDESSECNLIKYLPLSHAINSSQNHIVKWLLDQKKVNIDLRDSNGIAPIHSASESDNIEAMKLLLSHNADINFTENCSDKAFSNHKTAIFEVKSLEMASLLLAHGDIDLSIMRSNNFNVINSFAGVAKFELCELVIQKLKSTNQLELINCQNVFGNTALHSACSSIASPISHLKTVKLLVDNGADLTVKNLEGKYAYELISSNQKLKDMLKIKTKEALKEKSHDGDEAFPRGSFTPLNSNEDSKCCSIS